MPNFSGSNGDVSDAPPSQPRSVLYRQLVSCRRVTDNHNTFDAAASMAAPARVPRSFVLLAELEKGEKGLGAGLFPASLDAPRSANAEQRLAPMALQMAMTL